MTTISNTEVVERICGVTMHGLDRINERFMDDNIPELIDSVLAHIRILATINCNGTTTHNYKGISTVMELHNGTPILVTAYPTEKTVKYATSVKSKGRRKNKRC